MKRSVYIAIPTLDGKVGAALTQFLCAAERHNYDPSSPWAFSKGFYLGYKPVAYMRNSQYRDFLASDCDLLWTLDADIVPPPRAFELLDVDADIVAGAIPGYKTSEDGGIALQLLAFVKDADGKWDTLSSPGDAVRSIDAAGAGCMVIKRHVLADPAMRLAPDTVDEFKPPDWCPAIFHDLVEPWGKLALTGDLDFCERASGLGYSIKLWPYEFFGQYESLDLRDVAAYGARCAATAEKVTV